MGDEIRSYTPEFEILIDDLGNQEDAELLQRALSPLPKVTLWLDRYGRAPEDLGPSLVCLGGSRVLVVKCYQRLPSSRRMTRGPRMASPVKVSDRLLELAKSEARATHRSATGQIEHWATLGRAVEALLGHAEMLALKRTGGALPLPAIVGREEVRAQLAELMEGLGHEALETAIRPGEGPVYAADPEHPGRVVEIRPDGTRHTGVLRDREFVPEASSRGTQDD